MVKTITIKNEVYNKLIAIKKPDQSFSDLFNELIIYSSPENTLNQLKGSVEFTSKEKLLDEIYKKRDEKRF